MSTSLQQRKKPTQKRAQKTVDKILMASAEILSESGIEALTTNRVARQAKVNIASVYQYYPNKEAILNDLMEQAMGLTSKMLSEKALELSNLTLREGLQQGLRYVVDMYRQSEPLFSQLFGSQQLIFSSTAFDNFKKVISKVGSTYIKKENQALTGENADRALYVCYHSIVSVMAHHLKGSEAGRFSDQQIIDELCNMVCKHLTRGD